MAKFSLSDTDSVIASVRDPVALDCISKLTQNAANNPTVSTGQQGSAVSLVTQEPTPPPLTVNSLLSSTVPRPRTIAPLTPVTVATPSSTAVKVISHQVGTVSRQTTVQSEIPPLCFASGDLLQLPVITLPLVACSITSGDNMPAVTTDKSFVTVAAVTDLSSLSESVVIKPAYSPL